MNGPHDMGGMQCFGPVLPEENEPVFHTDWEKKALALTVGMGFTGMWNIDISRHARESLPPNKYLSLSYYEIWIAGLQKLMLERGMVTGEEIQTGEQSSDPVPVKQVLGGEQMPAALAAGGPVERTPEAEASFKPGDKVRTLNINPAGHTRLPRYARNRSGTISLVHGCHVFPDTNAHGNGENPAWLYCVEFDAVELFGNAAEAGNTVMVDCWEPYLERA